MRVVECLNLLVTMSRGIGNRGTYIATYCFGNSTCIVTMMGKALRDSSHMKHSVLLCSVLVFKVWLNISTLHIGSLA